MSLGMIVLNQSINTTQNYAIWIQIVLLFTNLLTKDVYKSIACDVEK